MKRAFNWLRGIVTSFLGNNCTMHAAGLTYFSLLAIVPILCCMLVAAKACNVDQYAREQINAQIDLMLSNVERGIDDETKMSPEGQDERSKKQIAAAEFARQARSISNRIFERVEKFDVGTLGWIGFGLLLWTIISSLGMVEVSFNQIWCVPKPRPIWKRAYIYLFLMVVLPVLATVAMSLPVLNLVKNVIVATLGASWLTKWVGDGLIWLLESVLFRVAVTLSLSSLLFGFFFWIMPNCPVRFRRAWIGGAVTAVLFGGWVKLCAVAQVGIANSSALYGSFAVLPIVLAWLYMSWQIVLLGSCITRALHLPLKEETR